MKKLTFLLGILLPFASCTKQDGGITSPLKSAEIRRAISMREGSYFIYKNTVTNELDSFWVYHFNEQQYISCHMKDIHENSFKWSFSLQYKFKGKETMVVFINGYGLNPVLMIPFDEGESYLSTEEDSSKLGLQMRAIHETLEINGKTYDKVYEVYEFTTQYVNNTHYTVSSLHSFISPENGLIKFRFRRKDDSSIIGQDTWELTNSKIIR